MKRHRLWLVLLATAAALAAPLAFGSGSASSSTGCMFVNGHLLDAHATDTGEGTVGRMIGSIQGDYHVFQGNAGPFYDPQPVGVRFGTGDATTETSNGNLTWREDGVLDQWNEDEYNAAVLAQITGGTGIWAGATGHLILSGYWHISTMSGQFDYRGTICWDE